MTRMLIVHLALLGACANAELAPSPCDELASTLTACGVAPDEEFMAGCAAEPAIAEQLAGQTCEQLATGGKADLDLFGRAEILRVFEAHQGKRFLGVNTVGDDTACGLTTTEDYTLHYNWLRAPGPITPDLEEYPNVISEGHFTKAWFRRKLISSSGGPLSLDCLIRGRCSRSELTIAYDGHDRITELRYEIEGELRNLCTDLALAP
jgi:hypothetical protein